MSIILTIAEVSGSGEEVLHSELSTLPSRTLEVTLITATDPAIATTNISDYDYEWFLIGKPDTSGSGLAPVIGSPHRQILNNIDIWGTYRVFCIATNKGGAQLGQSETNILKSAEENFINIRVKGPNFGLEKPAISQRGWNSQYNQLVDVVETSSTSFTLAADSGTADSFTAGNTLTFTGDIGVETTVDDNEIVIGIDSTVATLSGTQTLTNKTLTDPIIGNIIPTDSNILKISNSEADNPDKPIAVQISKPENGNAYLVIADENGSSPPQLTGGRFVYEGDSAGEGNLISGTNTFGLQALEADSVVDVFRSNVDGTFTAVMAKFDNVNQTGGTVDLFGKTIQVGGQTANKAAVEIGGTTGAKTVDTISAIAGSTITFDAGSTITLNGTGISGTVIKDEDNMTSDSDTALATQQSIKAYVDSKVGITIAADSGSSDSINPGETLTFIGGTGIDTTTNSFNDLIIGIDQTVVTTLSGIQTLSNKTLTSAVLNTDISGTAILDEDNMASNSNTKLATQQSIRAYVDSQVAGVSFTLAADSGTNDTFNNGGTLTFVGGTGIDTTVSDDTITIAIDSTVATLSSTQTLTNKTLTDPIIERIIPPTDSNILKISALNANSPQEPVAVQISKPEDGNAYLVIADENASDELTGGRFVYEGDQTGEGNILSGVNTFGLQALEADSVVDVFRSNVDGTFTAVMAKFDNVNQTGGTVDLFGKTIQVGGQTANKAAVEIGGTADAKTVDTISAVTNSTMTFDAGGNITISSGAVTSSDINIRASKDDPVTSAQGKIFLENKLVVNSDTSETTLRAEFHKHTADSNHHRNGIFYKHCTANFDYAENTLESTSGAGDVCGPGFDSNFLYFWAAASSDASTSGNVRRFTISSTSENFTGQHNTTTSNQAIVDQLTSHVGLIVSSNGTYKRWDNRPSIENWVEGIEAITIAEALPVVDLSNTRNDKKVFGVISNRPNEYVVDTDSGEYEEDQDGQERRFGTIKQEQIRINSIGEGAIWITNVNGDLENGDYITSSEIPGYGMKQDDDLLHNYTVAKITQDCNFDINSTVYRCEEITYNGVAYKKAFVGCTYHCG